MDIDPVVFLAEELRCKERALRDAVAGNKLQRSRGLDAVHSALEPKNRACP